MGSCAGKKKRAEEPIEYPDSTWDGVYDYQDEYVPFENLPEDVKTHIKHFVFEFPGNKRFNLH